MNKGTRLVALLLLLLVFMVPSLASEAVDITDNCTITSSYTKKKHTSLHDGKYTSHWETEKDRNPWLALESRAAEIASLYLCFSEMPESYVIQVKQSGRWVDYAAGNTAIYHAYYQFNQPVSGVRVQALGDKKQVLGFNEVYAFSQGERPDWVQVWQPTVSKADIMFLVAHPDDELLFFGGAIPTYAAERGKDVLVAYLTYSNNTRRSEALNGLWTMGVRNYPVIGTFRDKFSKGNFAAKLKDAYKVAGGENNVVGWVVELFRKYQPEVVVTQDEYGEYGHAQHLMVVDAAKKAVTLSAGQDYADSLGHGAWQVKKLYLHLYPSNAIYMNWDVPLSSMGGKTGLDLAKEAYALHITQIPAGFSVEKTGMEYNNTHFGLYYSTVGDDVLKNDFLENIQ